MKNKDKLNKEKSKDKGKNLLGLKEQLQFIQMKKKFNYNPYDQLYIEFKKNKKK